MVKYGQGLESMNLYNIRALKENLKGLLVISLKEIKINREYYEII